MLIFVIDDESKALNLLRNAVRAAAPKAEILEFSSGLAALEAIQTEQRKPEAIFADIIMPELDGLELAARLRTAAPDTKLIFVTGYTDYALDAYQLHANGYIIKPVEPQRICAELEHLAAPPLKHCREDRLCVRCFGHFEVFWKNEPLHFGRSQSKELLAFLIDRRGAFCSAEEIIAGLWEDVENLSSAKHRLRNLSHDLRSSLRTIGMEGLLLSRRNQLAILPAMIDCDYYRMLNGDMDAVNAFRGEYMAQYSWAELTKGDLYFRNVNLEQME